MLLSELVEALDINLERTPFVYRIMRIVIHYFFFIFFFLRQGVSTTPGDNDEEGGEGYLLAPASRLLLEEDPLG
ncbi:putative winged helix-like DNA-binding domain superfamily [Helianthus anomalus]